jgi:hypothetical protein
MYGKGLGKWENSEFGISNSEQRKRSDFGRVAGNSKWPRAAEWSSLRKQFEQKGTKKTESVLQPGSVVSVAFC